MSYRILDVEVHELANDDEHFVLLAFPDTFSTENRMIFANAMERIYVGRTVLIVTGSATPFFVHEALETRIKYLDDLVKMYQSERKTPAYETAHLVVRSDEVSAFGPEIATEIAEKRQE